MTNEWDKVADSYSRAIGERGDYLRQALTNPYITSHLPSGGRGIRILDLGCGEGYLARLLPDSQMMGVDSSAALLNLARQKHSPGEWILADITQPLKLDGKFDAVVINMALQDVEDVGGALTNAHTYLNPGGVLVISVPHPAFRRPVGNWARTVGDRLLGREPFVRVRRYATPFRARVRLAGIEHPTTIFHRPFSWYIKQVSRTGFRLVDVSELTLTEADVDKFGQPRFLTQVPAVLAMTYVKV